MNNTICLFLQKYGATPIFDLKHNDSMFIFSFKKRKKEALKRNIYVWLTNVKWSNKAKNNGFPGAPGTDHPQANNN